jgi:hypothetical protein
LSADEVGGESEGCSSVSLFDSDDSVTAGGEDEGGEEVGCFTLITRKSLSKRSFHEGLNKK